MKILKFLAYIFFNLLYLGTNFLWLLAYLYTFFGDTTKFPIIGIFLYSVSAAIMVAVFCICFVGFVKLAFFPLLAMILGKIKFIKNFLNKLENDNKLQIRVLINAFIFDTVALLGIITYGLLTTEKDMIKSYFFVTFEGLIFFCGGVFLSYLGLVLWLRGKKFITCKMNLKSQK